MGQGHFSFKSIIENMNRFAFGRLGESHWLSKLRKHFFLCVQYWVIFQRILDYFHYIFKHETTCMRGWNLKKITIEKNTIDSFIPASGIPRESFSSVVKWDNSPHAQADGED